jgi:hypothetical protein
VVISRSQSAGGEAEPQPLAAADDAPGAGEEPQPQLFQFPSAALPVRASTCVQASSSNASATISHQTLFWSKPCQGQVAQSGLLGAADPSGPRSVAAACGVVPSRRVARP